MKKISFILILCVLLSFGMNIVVSAKEYEVTPRYANTSRCDRQFWIENDTAIISVGVYGIHNVTALTTVRVTLEKKGLLGLWWKEEASWERSSTQTNSVFEFTEEVKSGTYRCNFEIIIEGNGGSADVITDQLTATN